MDHTEPEPSIAILHSLFYLGLTEIPVKARYGDASVLYNHKTRLLAPVDKNGNSYLEPGGIYTVESLLSDLVKFGSVGPVCVSATHRQESSAKTMEQTERSFFKSIMGSSPTKNRRTSLGIIPSASNRQSMPAATKSEDVRTVAHARL